LVFREIQHAFVINPTGLEVPPYHAQRPAVRLPAPPAQGNKKAGA
jgi:hypothetical protein